MRIPTALLLACWIAASANALSHNSLPLKTASPPQTSISQASSRSDHLSCRSDAETSPTMGRRVWVRSAVFQSLGWGFGVSLVSSLQPTPVRAADLPTVTTDEFLLILRDSARSIRDVEFSGPKSETVVVKLVDGTAFGIRDVVESPTDPRSPLKIAAYCRENQVPTRFLTIEQALASAPKRKKVYTNQRVAEANAKERERLARMEQDERERLAELYRMQQQGN